MYTIVTGFFDIGRENWVFYKRSVESYLESAKRVMSLHDNMVIYVEPEFVDFVKEHRKQYPHMTKIIPTKIEELPYHQYHDQIKEIMKDRSFMDGLVDPFCPEVNDPLYDIVMWSKIPLVVRTVESNPFMTDQFVWVDFGIHPHMLKERLLNKPLFFKVPDKIKMLCRSYPSPGDLNIKKFYKSHINRLVGAVITGSGKNFKILNEYLEQEVQDCLTKRVVDSDQSLFAVIFLKHPEIFELYYGNTSQILTNYEHVTENLLYVFHIALTCRGEGNPKVLEEVLTKIEKYDPNIWKNQP